MKIIKCDFLMEFDKICFHERTCEICPRYALPNMGNGKLWFCRLIVVTSCQNMRWSPFALSCIASRVARLAFLGPNSRNLAFFEVVWHEKMVYGMYVIVWPFLMVLAWKNIVWHFLKLLAQLLLSAWNYRTFSQDKGPLFSATAHSRRYKRLCRLSDVTGQKTILFWARLRKLRQF